MMSLNNTECKDNSKNVLTFNQQLIEYIEETTSEIQFKLNHSPQIYPRRTKTIYQRI